MSTDFEMVTTVKREFARRLPSDLVTLVLEFSNEANAEWKQACLWAVKNRAWMSKMRMLRNIADVQIIHHIPFPFILQCPPEELLRSKGAPLVRTWVRYLNQGVQK